MQTHHSERAKGLLLSLFGIAMVMTPIGCSDTSGSSAANVEAKTASSTSGPTELPSLDVRNTDITHEDYGRQLDVVLPYLEERREQSLREVADELRAENRVPLPDPNQYPAGSDMHRAVTDQNNITADLWTISGEQNTIFARNLLNGVFWNNPDSTTDAYDLTEQLIGNGKGRIKEYTDVNETSPIITRGVLGNRELTGAESYQVLLTSWTEPKSYEQVISKRVSQDGKHSNNVVIESIQWGDRGFVEHPSQLRAPS